MKICKIQIHNIRSINDCTIDMADYSVIIGQNNVGKSNVLAALRMFYDKLKFNEYEDMPKTLTPDKEAWVEITFNTSEEEQRLLKDEYRSSDNLLKLRRIFKSENEAYVIKTTNSNIFAYENGVLSTNNFYGSKNVSLGKIGELIYIPAVNKIEDITKTSGTSPLRNVIEFVIKSITKSSDAYAQLQHQYSEFSKTIKEEQTVGGLSLNTLTEDINAELKNWGISCDINITSIDIDTIIKNQIQLSMIDDVLNSKIELSNYGQGFQRSFIYALIKLTVKYVDHSTTTKKDFNPDFTIIAFEEPEAFLHISQQETMNYNLGKLAQNQDTQVIITSHSTTFASRNIYDFDKIIRLSKVDGITLINQINNADVQNITRENLELLEEIKKRGDWGEIPIEYYRKYRDKDPNSSDMLELESFRYLSWIDSERAGIFFAGIVIICEGATEKAVFDYLLATEWGELKEQGIYILDAMGKFNINRYMNLFNKLGIVHSVLFDKDKNQFHRVINDFILNAKNSYTRQIYVFDVDFEQYLGIELNGIDKSQKPINAIKRFVTNKISTEDKRQLRIVFESLLNTGNIREVRGMID